MDRIDIIKDRNRRWGFVNTGMNLFFPWNIEGNSWATKDLWILKNDSVVWS
jgi:hypothetical protein